MGYTTVKISTQVFVYLFIMQIVLQTTCYAKPVDSKDEDKPFVKENKTSEMSTEESIKRPVFISLPEPIVMPAESKKLSIGMKKLSKICQKSESVEICKPG